MAELTVDPSQVRTIEVDPSAVSAVHDATALQKGAASYITHLAPGALELIANPLDVRGNLARAWETAKALGQGMVNEPARVWGELARSGAGMAAGDIPAAAYHLAGAVPVFGPATQEIATKYAAGQPAEATGALAALATPFAGEIAGTAGTAATRAGRLAGAMAKAGGRDVTIGAGKVALGAALAKAGPLGEIADVLAGVPIIKSGVKQMGRGVRAAFAEPPPTVPVTELSPEYFQPSGPAYSQATGPQFAEFRPPGQAPPVWSEFRPGEQAAPSPAVAPETTPPAAPAAAAAAAPEVAPVAAAPVIDAAQAAIEGDALIQQAKDAGVYLTTPHKNALANGNRAIIDLVQRKIASRQAAAAAEAPSAATQTGLPATEAPPAVETPTPLQRPGALEIAQQLQQEMQQSGTLPPETGRLSPTEAEAAFQAQKARIEQLQTQNAALEQQAAGPRLEPLPEGVPLHYADMHRQEGASNTIRAFNKDQRIANYLLSKNITPEAWEAMPLKQQNELIVEAPTASGKGKHKPYLERPEGAGAGPYGRWADEGIRHITDTMRWIQEQTPAAEATIVPENVPSGPPIRRTPEPIQEPGRPVERKAPEEAVSGAETAIRIPGEQTSYQARYAVRELDDVHPSHNPHTFQANPAYEYRNDRNYSDPANQERIVLDSQPGRFAPEYLITDSPDAVNGAPVISEGGSVLGGNSRAMKLARVYANNPQDAAAYRALLERQADRFGIDPAQVRGMKRPVLVRELVGETDKPQQLITDLNKSGTAALTGAERATADARRMSSNAADYLAKAIESEGPEATLRDALSGNQGAKIINQLVDDGVFTMQEKPALVDAKTGAVTSAAKERVSKMLLGQVFADSDQMMRTPAEIRNKLERIVSPLLQSGQKPGFDILPAVRESLNLLEYARAHGITQLSDVLNQQSLFGSGPKFTPEAAQLAEFLRDEKPTRIAGAFRRYVVNAEPTMFGESTPAEAFADAFGAQMPPEAAKMTPAEAEATFQEQKTKAARKRKTKGPSE